MAWLAHLYTGLGASAALAATLAILRDDYRSAFLWLGAQVAIDGTDGVLARALQVKERLPHVDGARLDDVIDYLSYVFVPVLLMLHAGLLPATGGFAVASAVLLASGYGFAQTTAKVKTTDHFFTGFPSYWNLVAVYVFVWQLDPAINAAILLVLAVLVFAPLRYVYPSRTITLRTLTLTLAAVWAALLTWIVWRLPERHGTWLTVSLVFPVYYLVLSVALDHRSRHRLH
jgi:phosphatidylcholine synthase